MFSGAALRKSPPSIRQALAANQRLGRNRFFSSQPQASTSAYSSSRPSSGVPFGFGDSKRRGDSALLLRTASSGILVASCGIYYLSSSFSDENSSISLADCPKDNTLVPEPGDRDFQSLSSAKKPKFIFGDAYRRRVFFNYEKRIRLQSHPEKVFAYFASFQMPSGEILMTPADLMRTVVPVFPPSESNHIRGGFLRGEKPGELHCPPSEFFLLFDTNSDGLVSFPEYMFFVTLLSIPESSFSVAFKMFDLDNNGEIDREEFKKVMALMQSQSRHRSHNGDRRRGWFKSTEPIRNGGLIEYFFGKDGQNRLQHYRFVQFLRDLQAEILRLEFAHYDYKRQDTISAKDFALSLVAAADISHINRLLDRVDEISDEPSLKEIRIGFEEFKNFAELRMKLQSLSLAIFSYGRVNGVLTKRDFKRAASQVCGVDINDGMTDIIFHVFDANQDGTLSSEEFIRVLQRREGQASQTREAGLKGLFTCWLNCSTNCPISKLVL